MTLLATSSTSLSTACPGVPGAPGGPGGPGGPTKYSLMPPPDVKAHLFNIYSTFRSTSQCSGDAHEGATSPRSWIGKYLNSKNNKVDTWQLTADGTTFHVLVFKELFFNYCCILFSCTMFCAILKCDSSICTKLEFDKYFQFSQLCGWFMLAVMDEDIKKRKNRNPNICEAWPEDHLSQFYPNCDLWIFL